jgi:hypothetical protein
VKYKVRSKGGELEFSSFGEVERFWLMGLIEPDDEVLEEGKTVWRKAGTIPLLANARRTGEQAWGGAWALFALIGILGGSIALYLLRGDTMEQQIAGGLVALVTAAITIQINLKAFRRSKPHG